MFIQEDRVKIGDTYNPYRAFHGAFVPNWLLCRTEISHGAKLCFARLAQFAGNSGDCFPSHETLGSELGVEERQVRNYLDELESNSLISREKELFKSTNYYFKWHPWAECGIDGTKLPTAQRRQDSADGKKLPPTDGNFRSIADGKILPGNRISTEENHSKENQSNDRSVVTPDLIYDAYPRKVARSAAIKSIASAISRTKISPDELLEKTQMMALVWDGHDLQYCPHPSTWFNQDRFQDDPAMWNPRKAGPRLDAQAKATDAGRALTPSDLIDLKQAIEEEEESVAELRREAFRPGLVQDEAWKRERAAKMESYESRKANLERLKNRLSEHRQARFA